MADEKTQWTLDLDVHDALEGLNKVNEGMGSAFSTDSVQELIHKFAEAGIALGLVAGAVLAVKTAMDLTFEGEQIEAINRQFETLSKNAGIFGEDMKEALVKAAGGLADDTDLIKAANKALVGLGDNAKKLPEILEMSRKVTSVFGGDLMTNFGNITQAIESGNVRLLRHYGIIIDQKKAYEDYAKSIGVAASELSKSGQQAAIMQAVLEKSKTSLAGVDVDAMKATNAFTEFKVAMSDMGEAIALLFNKTLGPSVASFFHLLSDSAKDSKNWIKSTFGEGPESAEARVALLQSKIAQTQKTIQALEAPTKSWMDRLFPGDKQGAIIQAKNNLASLNAELAKAKLVTDQLETAKDAARKKDLSGDAQLANQSKVDMEKRRADILKFNTEVTKLREGNLKQEIAAANAITTLTRKNAALRLTMEHASALQIKKIEADKTLNEKQKAALIEEINRKLNNDLLAMKKNELAQETQAINNYEQDALGSAAGIGRGFVGAFQKAAIAAQDFSKMGEAAFQSVTGGAIDSFVAMADGSEGAGEALKKHLLGALGELAVQQGSVMLLGSISVPMLGGLPNPAGLAAGAALIALGAVLKGISGAGGASAPAASASSAGGGGAVSAVSMSAPGGPSNLQQQPPQKTVNLTISGNYYDTNESRTAMMDMIRGATDATDFNYFKVGGQ